MPTVIKIGGLRFAIYPNDHRPAHVHVIGDGHEAIFLLGCADGPTSLRENYGFSRKQLRRIAELVEEHRIMLCLAWEKLHGVG